ncbi:hypothetical protein [Pedobacter sp.]|uniref:hypothetical protein n=1 Tax=Pedobacter sp. TaxID=1411316 RepID=UPI003C36BB17
MKNVEKYVAIFAVLLLIAAVFWWMKWKRQEDAPVEKKLMDSIDYHIKQAEGHANIAREYVEQADKYAEIYNNPVIDSVERSDLGAKIWADAIRKADSLHQLAPR